VLATWPLARLANETVAVPTQAVNTASLAALVKQNYGGILLFGTTAPANLGATITKLDATTGGAGLLIMTDEEGGGVMRLDNLVTAFPWAQTMGRTMTPSQITAVARRVGAQLLAAGVNMDLAPVLDVDGRAVYPGAADPDGFRSFSGSPSVVSADGAAFMQGLAQSGVIPVAKHFPGLGGSTGNTDTGPAATLAWTTLEAGGLTTFVAAIAKGVPAIMVANATVPGLTTIPASLSAPVMTTELRGKLHFTGMVMTDSLTAGAISALHISVPVAAARAVIAGADMVLLGDMGSVKADVTLSKQTSQGIVLAVEHGQLTRAQLTTAVLYDLTARHALLCTAAP
jgi:beta-N-acetylhexosaminidase